MRAELTTAHSITYRVTRQTVHSLSCCASLSLLWPAGRCGAAASHCAQRLGSGIAFTAARRSAKLHGRGGVSVRAMRERWHRRASLFVYRLSGVRDIAQQQQRSCEVCCYVIEDYYRYRGASATIAIYKLRVSSRAAKYCTGITHQSSAHHHHSHSHITKAAHSCEA